MSAYLVGNLIFIIAWIGLFILLPKIRKLQIFGSFLLLPFAITDIWFRPDYWHPPLLIHQIEPLSLETALYCFSAGGIAIVVGATVIKFQNNFKINWRNLALFFIVAFGLYAIFQIFGVSNAMNNLNLSFIIVWLILLLNNSSRNIISLITAVIFAIFTIIAINIGRIFYPNFVSEYWNLSKLWPTFLGAPMEEVLFAGILAALWTLLPKYLTRKV